MRTEYVSQGRLRVEPNQWPSAPTDYGIVESVQDLAGCAIEGAEKFKPGMVRLAVVLRDPDREDRARFYRLYCPEEIYNTYLEQLLEKVTPR